MIYQDVYSQLARPMDMFGAVQEVKQAQALEQQRQNTLAEQARAAARKSQEDAVYKGQLATQALIGFKKLSPQQKAAQWTSYRQRIESLMEPLMPEIKGGLPSVWDSNDPANDAELDTLIEGWGSTFFQPEQVKLGADETLLQVQPGVGPKEIASGKGKAGKGLEIKAMAVGDSYIETPERTLPSGNILRGPYVYDQVGDAMPKEEYFKLYPSERPVDVRPESQSKSKPTTQAVPSPTNRAGETNQGFPIDMSMAAPGGVNSLVAMNIPADAEAPGVAPPMGGNALFGGMGMALPVDIQQVTQAANMLAQEQDQFMPPNQFAQLRPAGSAPNRFGSPGVEGMEFAATGGAEPKIVGGRVVYTAKPKPEAAKETFRDMTPEEIRASGRDPARFSGQVSSLGQKRFDALPSATAAEIEEAQLKKLRAEAQMAETKAEEEKKQARKSQQDAVSLLRGIKRIELALGSLQSSPFFDTGVIDQYFMAKTDKGQELTKANEAILGTVKRINKTPGEGAFSNLDVDLLKAQLPGIGSPMPSNIDSLRQIKTDILAMYGVQAAVSNKAERDALPPGTIYVDINTGIKYQKGEK